MARGSSQSSKLRFFSVACCMRRPDRLIFIFLLIGAAMFFYWDRHGVALQHEVDQANNGKLNEEKAKLVLEPVSKRDTNQFGGLGATIVDALDNLFITDLQEKIEKATEVLGGLLSSLDLSKNRVFLTKAQELADRLLPAPNTATEHRTLEFRRRSLADSTPSSHKDDHKARRWAVGLALGLVAGALAALLVATILRLCVFYMQKGPYLHGPIIFHPNISPRMLLFLEKEDALSQEDLIGEGAAGKVYKVQLENDKAVAVKTVHVRDDQRGVLGQKQIQSELETLGCIRHRNLVSLLAYVHTPSCHLLLYEYMKYGSLSHALQQVRAGALELPWPIRHKIAIGTAQGLSYLHYQSKPKIVHRDLKPSNILLDANFKAHIADFGLAKIIPNSDTHVSTGVAGTVGYIAPEYNEACRFTEMCDVYSFGVVLAVLLTGKDPKDPFFQTVPGGTIASWLHDLTQSPDVKEAIDPHLRTDDNEDEEQIVLALKVAAFCTLGNPAKRPTSKEALVMLTQIRDDADAHL